MPRQTKIEIEQSLLKGAAIPWTDGSQKQTLQLDTSVQRRLYAFLLQSTIRSAKALPVDFVKDLAKAFDSDLDPATRATPSSTKGKTTGPWHLTKIETEGFGGINIWGGSRFSYELDGHSLLIDGPNGSGKSSLVAAITWALTGQRPRDASRNADETGRSQVFDSNGTKIGEWPALACYPDKAALLSSGPKVLVKLTFKNQTGVTASVERSLSNGQIKYNADAQLEFPPVLVETGLLMPTRLAHIRFGQGEQHLTEVVQTLTGFDEIATLGDFVSELCHKGREYLGYAKTNRRDEIFRQFTESLLIAKEALSSIQQKLPDFTPSDTRDKSGPMATLGKALTEKATATVSVIGADLSTKLDLTLVAVQQQVATAIDGAKSDVHLGLPGLPIWETVSNIKNSLTAEVSGSVEAAVTTAEKRLKEALELHNKSIEDSRFQLKAIAGAWHSQHSDGAVENCPLCSQPLDKNQALASEIERLKGLGDAARRTLRDNLNWIQKDLESTIPETLKRYNNEVKSISPKKDIETAIRARFIDGPRYANYLIGLAELVTKALPQTPTAELKATPALDSTGMPKETSALLEAIVISRRFVSIAEWFSDNQGSWNQWWSDLTGNAQSPTSANCLFGKLEQLDEAMRASTPYRTAAKGLRDAWKYGTSIDAIDVEQNHRQNIADQLEPLKYLKKFAESETKSAIEGLSSRMSALLDRIHLVEKLKFHSTHLDKKTGVTVRGGFDPDIQIDASLVANASWLRALLWSFTFAVREEAIEQLGEDRLPLFVLDDPQSTFDLTHRHRWGLHLAALQSPPSSAQIILTSHDEQFIAQLGSLKVHGRRAYLAAAGTDTGCLTVVEGDSLKRTWDNAVKLGTPDAAQAYIAKARIHLEAMLKIMLRGEVDTSGLTIGKLRDKIKGLHKSQVTPWTRPIFADLANRLNTCTEILIMESSHHTTGLALGMQEAIDVEVFWNKEVWPRLEKAFRSIREYRLLHGESKAMHADPSLLELPDGYKNAVRQIPLEIHGRASALTDGRLADGHLTVSTFRSEERETVVLGNHDAYRIVAPTLEPVARPGDILLVAQHEKVTPGSLVVATCSEHLVARRFQIALEHPDIAILIAQAVNPSSIAPPLIAHISTVNLRKVIGVIFDNDKFRGLSTTAHEVSDCGGEASVKDLISGTLGLIQVSGDSAEPLALHGQYLLIGNSLSPETAYRTLNNKPVIATDSDGNQYFKRLRVVSKNNVSMESLQSGEDYPPVLLSMPGQSGLTMTQAWPVLGILFERP